MKCLVAWSFYRGFCLVRLSLLAKSTSYSVVFFSQNKSANHAFCHCLSAKQTRRWDNFFMGHFKIVLEISYVFVKVAFCHLVRCHCRKVWQLWWNFFYFTSQFAAVWRAIKVWKCGLRFSYITPMLLECSYWDLEFEFKHWLFIDDWNFWVECPSAYIYECHSLVFVFLFEVLFIVYLDQKSSQ